MDSVLQCDSGNVTVLHAEEESSTSLLNLSRGTIHSAELSSAYLLQLLQPDSPPRFGWFFSVHTHTSALENVKTYRVHSTRCPGNRTDPQRLAALHCLLVYMGNDPNLEMKVRTGTETDVREQTWDVKEHK